MRATEAQTMSIAEKAYMVLVLGCRQGIMIEIQCGYFHSVNLSCGVVISILPQKTNTVLTQNRITIRREI